MRRGFVFLAPAIWLLVSCASVSGVAEGASDRGRVHEGVAPTQEEVIAAVKAGDAGSLERILADVDDVRTIVGGDVLLLHMAEEAAGVFGLENPVVRILVEKKAYILQRDENGRSWARVIQDMELAGTPRHEYVRSVVGDKFRERGEAIRADDLPSFREFEPYGPCDAITLWEAVNAKAVRVAAYMLRKGADVGHRAARTGAGVLHAVCDHRSPRPYFELEGLLEALLAAGADPDAADRHGLTPLYALAMSECMDNPDRRGDPVPLFRLLLEAGADPNATDSIGWTAMDKMLGNLDFPNPAVVEMMLDHGCVISDISIRTCPSNLELVRLLVKYGADPSTMARTRSPFRDADEQTACFRYLLSAGAVVGDFDLRMSVIHPGSMRFLVERGADPNTRYGRGGTALHSAVRAGYGETVAVLLAAGADANARRDDGKTPLDMLRSGDEGIESALRAAGGMRAAELSR